jgi:hypothetical protein
VYPHAVLRISCSSSGGEWPKFPSLLDSGSTRVCNLQSAGQVVTRVTGAQLRDSAPTATRSSAAAKDGGSGQPEVPAASLHRPEPEDARRTASVPASHRVRKIGTNGAAASVSRRTRTGQVPETAPDLAFCVRADDGNRTRMTSLEGKRAMGG